MQESDATYDRRAFPLCRPTDCSKGAECERFKTEFINGAQRIEMVTLTTGPAAGGATLEYDVTLRGINLQYNPSVRREDLDFEQRF